MPTKPGNSSSIVFNDRTVELVVQKGVSFPEEGRKLLTELTQHYLVAETAGSRTREDGGVLRPHGVLVWNGEYLTDDIEVQFKRKMKIYCLDETAQEHQEEERLARVRVEVKKSGKETYFLATFEYELGRRTTPKEAAFLRSLPKERPADLFARLLGDAQEEDRTDRMLPWLR